MEARLRTSWTVAVVASQDSKDASSGLPSPFLKYWQYESERRAVAQKLIDFDKWYAEGFSSEARAKLQKESDAELPMPMEYVLDIGCAHGACRLIRPSSTVLSWRTRA